MTYACKNRAPFKERMVVQDGYFMDGVTRAPKMVSIPFRMARDCRYQLNDQYADKQCMDCAHRTTGTTPVENPTARTLSSKVGE